MFETSTALSLTYAYSAAGALVVEDSMWLSFLYLMSAIPVSIMPVSRIPLPYFVVFSHSSISSGSESSKYSLSLPIGLPFTLIRLCFILSEEYPKYFFIR